MQKQIYVVTYSSAHYAGAPSHCLVLAEDADEAADEHMFDMEYEQNYDQLEEDGLLEECPYVVDEVQLLEGSEFEEYVADEVQQINFYPKVNF